MTELPQMSNAFQSKSVVKNAPNMQNSRFINLKNSNVKSSHLTDGSTMPSRLQNPMNMSNMQKGPYDNSSVGTFDPLQNRNAASIS